MSRKINVYETAGGYFYVYDDNYRKLYMVATRQEAIHWFIKDFYS